MRMLFFWKIHPQDKVAMVHCKVFGRQFGQEISRSVYSLFLLDLLHIREVLILKSTPIISAITPLYVQSLDEVLKSDFTLFLIICQQNKSKQNQEIMANQYSEQINIKISTNNNGDKQ